MTCEDIRRYLSAWLDSELDSRTSLDLQAHLEACPPCHERVEAEARLEHGLRARLAETRCCDKFWQRLEGGLCVPAWWARPRTWLAAAAVLAVATVGVAVATRGPGTPPVKAGPDIAVAMAQRADDAARFVPTVRDGGPAPDGTIFRHVERPAFAGVPGYVSRHLAGAPLVGLSAPCPEGVAPHRLELVRAFTCPIGGREAPTVVYHCCDADICVFVLSPEVLTAFPGAREWLGAGASFACAVPGGCTLQIHRAGDLWVCATGLGAAERCPIAAKCARALVEAFVTR